MQQLLGLSKLFSGELSHDKVTRFLKNSYFDSKTLWQKAKPLVRKFEKEEAGVLIVDDSIQAKPHTDENALICWHWDLDNTPHP